MESAQRVAAMSQATFITDLTIGELEANFALYCKALRILVLEEKPINQFGEASSAAGRQSTHQHATDFGQEVIPAVLESGLSPQSYLFDGYWESIGTIKAFFDANLALADEKLSVSMMSALRLKPFRAICRLAASVSP